MSAPIISLVNDQPRTLSTDVAAHFGKKHLHVLRDIRKLMADAPADFNESNF